MQDGGGQKHKHADKEYGGNRVFGAVKQHLRRGEKALFPVGNATRQQNVVTAGGEEQ